MTPGRRPGSLLPGILAHGNVRTVAALVESTNKGGSAPAAKRRVEGRGPYQALLSARHTDGAGVDPASWKYPLAG